MTTPTQQPDLLPCPFCGEEASIEQDPFNEIEIVRCCYCGASAGDGATRDHVSARIAKWNRRAGTGGAVEPTPEEVERVERVLFTAALGSDEYHEDQFSMRSRGTWGRMARAVLSGAWRGAKP